VAVFPRIFFSFWTKKYQYIFLSLVGSIRLFSSVVPSPSIRQTVGIFSDQQGRSDPVLAALGSRHVSGLARQTPAWDRVLNEVGAGYQHGNTVWRFHRDAYLGCCKMCFAANCSCPELCLPYYNAFLALQTVTTVAMHLGWNNPR
jgi:hypothetical protein